MRRFFRKGNGEGYLLIAPFYIVFLLFSLIPIVVGFVYSFTNYDLFKKFDFVGFDNYIRLFDDSYYLSAAINTLEYSVYTIIVGMILGLLLALALKKPIYGYKFFRIGFYLPFVISMVAASMVWLWIFDPTYGILNQVVKLLGFQERYWLHDKNIALEAVALVGVWKKLGYNMLLFLSGLNSIPESYYEAAKIDGAVPIKQFFYITLPLLKPTTFFIFITSTIFSFNVFEQVQIMTGGGPFNSTTTIVHQIYIRAFEENNMGYAAAQSFILFGIIVIITILNYKLANREEKLELT